MTIGLDLKAAADELELRRAGIHVRLCNDQSLDYYYICGRHGRHSIEYSTPAAVHYCRVCRQQNRDEGEAAKQQVALDTLVSNAAIYNAIQSERKYQDERWGQQTGPDAGTNGHTVDEFALYILSYAQDLAKLAATTRGNEEKLNFVRKVTALGVACMEQHGAPER